MQIIPAIDIINGKCVRLVQGDFSQQKTYNENPLEIAKQFEGAGLQRLHLVDLDGARTGSITNLKVLEKIAAKTTLKIDFGGGIKNNDDVVAVFNAGACWLTIGTLAVKNEKLLMEWKEKYGAENFLLGADVKEEKITINGWQQTTQLNIFDFIRKYFLNGFSQIFCTDVGKDGKMEGPSIELYKKIMREMPNLFFIASGGVSSVTDLYLLSSIGCSAAIVGKAIYENKITLAQLKRINEC